jgi:HEAT repeat protein
MILRRLLLAFAATSLLVLVEISVLVGERHRELAGIWELQTGTFWLLPALAAIAFAGALAGALSFALLERANRRPERMAFALAFGAFAGVVAHFVGGGRHLQGFARREGFALAVAALGFVLAHVFAPRVGRALGRWPLGVALAAAGFVLGLELANRFVLVRLYPAFHAALAALALALAPFVLTPFLVDRRVARPRRSALGVVGLLLVGAAVGLRPASARLARFDNFRLVLLDAGPLAGQAVRLAALVAPPPPIGEAAACDELAGCVPASEPAAAGAGIDFRGRDFLLITIDALRADHVGAYGYGRPTTPQIDALARGGVRFERAYAPTPHTSYSVTSLMTGKYMRPLLLQGVGADSDTWAGLLRTYGYRTAAFYPPAVFFIDPDRFTRFRDQALGFEYKKIEFLEGPGRVLQVKRYLAAEDPARREFVWVHLFGPHEPYEAHPGHEFGDRDVDRYDSEIAYADETVGELVAAFRATRANGVVIVTADHGEEFGEHGGHYHGSSLYEEQVRVPLLWNAPGLAQRTLPEVVQTIDLLPTVLAALDIPRPPRLRGRDLGPLLAGRRAPAAGSALAETEEQAMLAEGSSRLICQRKLGACQLFDLGRDPGEKHDISGDDAARFRELKARLSALSASHGRYEELGLRREGKGWPTPILRGISGDGDAAGEIAQLLDDADVEIRRKAAEVLFELRRPDTAAALRLALTRDEDPEVKRWSALALTRLDQGAPLVNEIYATGDLRWKRLAALALAESGDKRGAAVLVAWWKDAAARDYERSRDLLAAFAKIRSKDAVWPLVQSLDDVRLRPYLAATLAAIGDDAARVPLAKAFAVERYQSARAAIAEALVALGADMEMAEPLVRWLGVPDPLPDGLAIAQRAKILEQVGGPDERARLRLARQSSIGAKLTLIVPRGGNGHGVRILVRAHSDENAGELRVGAPADPLQYDRQGKPLKQRNIPRIDPDHPLRFAIAPGPAKDRWATLPAAVGGRPGRPITLVFFGDPNVVVDAVAVVPLADELPPPAPKPWHPGHARGE